jgi:hypothetical protein
MVILIPHTDLTNLTDIWPLAIDARDSSIKTITAGNKICEICEICVTFLLFLYDSDILIEAED